MRRLVLFIFVVGPGLPATPFLEQASGEPLSTAFTYQGALDVDGVPLDGSADLRFSLYDTLTDGIQVGITLEFPNVQVFGGTFALDLDFGAGSFNGDARWLWLEVRSPHDPGDTEAYTGLSPRLPVSATPYALQTRGIFVDDQGTVTIGDAAGGSNAAARQPAPPSQLHAINANPNAVAILGENTATVGAAHGVHGSSVSSDAAGIFGESNAKSGTSSGVHGISDSPDGRGVLGQAEKEGVRGESSATTGPGTGVCGVSASEDGSGVLGHAQAAAGANAGVHGMSDSPDGRGVLGQAEKEGVRGESSATSGEARGVCGTSQSPDGAGVFGQAQAASGASAGVHGMSDSPDGRGVLGQAAKEGVRGESSATTGPGSGVCGVSASTSGSGVLGHASSQSGDARGVHGTTDATCGVGVLGEIQTQTMTTNCPNVGVMGLNHNIWGSGVYGESTENAACFGGGWETQTYGVHGRSTSVCRESAGVLAHGSPGGAAALKLLDGGITVSGVNRPAGDIAVSAFASSWEPLYDADSTQIGNTIELFFDVDADGNIVLLTVDAPTFVFGNVSYFAQYDSLKKIIIVTQMGCASPICPGPSEEIFVHYFVLRSGD